MQTQDKILRLLGLAKKAGKISSGGMLCEKAVKSGRARLVIVAKDASDNTKKRFKDMCGARETGFEVFCESMALGRSLGEPFRMCIAICDGGFAEKIAELLKEV